MLTPKEVRNVAMDYELFHAILVTGSTLFGCVVCEGGVKGGVGGVVEGNVRGVVMSILCVKDVVKEEIGEDAARVPKVRVECRCSGRFDLVGVAGDVDPGVWRLMRGECVLVHDLMCCEYADRVALADVEWRAWVLLKEVAALMTRLGGREAGYLMVEQELAVWAPGEYDRAIEEEEWNLTPAPTREVWSQRAEAFSFGLLRCIEASGDVMRKARDLTNTYARVELAIETLERTKAETLARLSLRDALK